MVRFSIVICTLSEQFQTEGNHVVDTHVMICELVNEPLRKYTCMKCPVMAYIIPTYGASVFTFFSKNSPEHAHRTCS